MAKRTVGHNQLFDAELERAIVSWCVQRDQYDEANYSVVADVKREHFYFEKNADLWDCICELKANGSPIDTITMRYELKKRGLFGKHFKDIVEYSKYMSFIDIDIPAEIRISPSHWVTEVVSLWQRRAVIELTKNSGSKFSDTMKPILECYGEIESEFVKIINAKSSSRSVPIESEFDSLLAELGERQNSSTPFSGVNTGIHSLNMFTGGWQKSDLIVVAARPGMGKTGFMLTQAYNAAILGVPVHISSLEMSRRQLLMRLVSIDSGLDVELLAKGKPDNEQLRIAALSMERMKKLKIWIDDTAAQGINEYRNELRRLVAKYGIGLSMFDYIQLASDEESKNNREQEVSAISRGLKIAAKENNIPIIALSQLSRVVETRSDKVPILSDLRESGAIEQDADCVVFIYRPEYYGFDTDHAGESTMGKARLIFAKYRNGAVGNVDIRFMGRRTWFHDRNQEDNCLISQMARSKTGIKPNNNFYEKESSNGGDDLPF
jgi:replicative DNA helicase